MKKRTVLITGSSSGIGLALATRFAQQGYNLILNGIESTAAKAAEELAQNYQCDYFFEPADMRQPQAIREFVEAGIQRFGGIDVLIANAGIQYVSPIEQFPEEKWNDILSINLSSAFHLAKAVWPGMKERQFGRIINMASAHGLTASPFKSAYVASKHGLLGLTKALALEGAEFNITVNAVCPGYVHTPIVENQIEDQMKAHHLTREEIIEKVMLAKQAVKEFISMDLIVDMVMLLADEKSSTITGAALPVDGGWTAA
ncbi:MAG: 3-hydroxybutyrate dehydrogenase [Chitinophagaceae bacterium]|nr:3-hydroxybutyrate dehydrogenase [Chitinophagaceae bacterium]